MNSTFTGLADHFASVRRSHGLTAAVSAASITVPHALGLGLIAFSPLSGDVSVAALALWSAALPGALLTLLAPRRGVIYAPTTVVALLFAAVVATVAASASSLRLAPAQVLAVCGATVALGFAFQWLFGVLRLASLARFLPISVTHGFAAGVGVAMVLGQVSAGFGAGFLSFDARTLRHLLLALAVVAVARIVQRRWPRVPGLLPAVGGLALLVSVTGLSPLFQPAMAPAVFAWPPIPDWTGVPWLLVAQGLGVKLVSLAMLMAIVNSLDVVVFNQELELDHGLHVEPNRALRRESLIGVVCGLFGLIPASTSASRSRAALAQAGPSFVVAPAHAALLLLVPMACLAGGLLLSGYVQVPQVMWSRAYAQAAAATWTQSWLVAMVFAVAGGVGALVAGLVVATFVLLHASASTVLRRALLDGERRSRRLRRAASEAWVAPRMNQVAVFELQGVVSFGVAAHLAEQVNGLLQPRHRWTIIEASRVPAWDSTALARLAALARDRAASGVKLVVSGLDARAAAAMPPAVHQAADLDRALEWAEDAILAESTPQDVPPHGADDALGDLAQGVSQPARLALQGMLTLRQVAAGQQVFAAGDTGAEIWIVQAGHITLSTSWPPAAGMRLATVGYGMAFGEMAFLARQPRTACAGSEAAPVTLLGLDRPAFDEWAASHPADALVFMSNLAQIGTRRLAATTRQLRAVLE